MHVSFDFCHKRIQLHSYMSAVYTTKKKIAIAALYALLNETESNDEKTAIGDMIAELENFPKNIPSQ
jgi:hypothetical protein